MNPTNPSSDSASTGTTAAEQFLAAELAATRRALQRTRIYSANCHGIARRWRT